MNHQRDTKKISRKECVLKPIGIIYTPFKNREGMPIQPNGGKGITGIIKIAPKYASGLKDLKGFSHIILIYFFHLSKGYKLLVKPFLDKTKRGVFATRAPKRPNPIGMSVVKLKKIKKTELHVENIDIISGTPLLDIKPYIPRIDAQKTKEIGWLKGKAHKTAKIKADKRFK